MFVAVISGLLYYSALTELHKSPRAPMPETGRVIPLKWGEAAVYITIQEERQVNRRHYVSMAALAFFAANLISFGWQYGLPMRGDRAFWKDFWNE